MRWLLLVALLGCKSDSKQATSPSDVAAKPAPAESKTLNATQTRDVCRYLASAESELEKSVAELDKKHPMRVQWLPNTAEQQRNLSMKMRHGVFEFKLPLPA